MTMTTTETQAAYLRRRRVQATEYLGGRCALCSTRADLQFDHIDPTTKVIEIGAAIAKHWSWQRLLVELAKCQLLCGPHHRDKTARELSVEHGGGASGRKNCPCDPCKARKAEYMRAYVRPSRRV